MKKRIHREKFENYQENLRKIGFFNQKEEEPKKEEEKAINYNSLSKNQLKELLKEKGIETNDSMKKDELINLITDSNKVIEEVEDGEIEEIEVDE